nr:hypothetical protein Iba_chr11eCG5070 [Ipomoea batatas]
MLKNQSVGNDCLETVDSIQLNGEPRPPLFLPRLLIIRRRRRGGLVGTTARRSPELFLFLGGKGYPRKAQFLAEELCRKSIKRTENRHHHHLIFSVLNTGKLETKTQTMLSERKILELLVDEELKKERRSKQKIATCLVSKLPVEELKK